MKIKTLGLIIVVATAMVIPSCTGTATQAQSGWKDNPEYTAIYNRLAKGWNTWFVEDALSQVFLPDGLAVTLRITDGKDTVSGPYIGDNGKGLILTPGGHAWDGSYSDLMIQWKERKMRIQTAADGDNLVVMATTVQDDDSLKLIVIPEMKWEREGRVRSEESGIQVSVKDKVWKVQASGGGSPGLIGQGMPGWTLPFKDTLVVTVNRPVDLVGVKTLVKQAESKLEKAKDAYGDKRDLYDAYQSVFAWNTIYDPQNDRVITPVSRAWCYGQGFVLFDWDTYFGAYQLSLDNKDLSYANLIAITKEITPGGFIPNFASAKHRSDDRSQPPVGAMVLDSIYHKYGDKWIVEMLFDDFLTWNRWWPEHRDYEGYLCWGTDPMQLTAQAGKLEAKAVNKLQGAKYESGLDNSPMYDSVSFDPEKHLMMLADVGLMSLYIMDCNALADLAEVVGRPDVRDELLERAKKYGKSLATLWDDETGIYLNKDLVTGKLSDRLSPTLFYPLLTPVPDGEKADRMIDEHLENIDEFWGDWVIPSIARNDPAYTNEYWRGRIWGPMNFLVYLGLKNHRLDEARTALVEKSRILLLKNFDEDRTVHENYNPDTGDGTSDDYYHWGALLGFMSFLEKN